jgi:RimJ/RimL family protein N-acetyltransferase
MTEHLGGPEDAESLDKRQARYQVADSRQYRIVVDGQPCGYVGYWQREWHSEPVWETGWAVLPAFQGRGIASRAMHELLRVIAAESDRRPVHAFPSVDNAASNAVCRKLGFELMGAFDFEYPPGHPLRCNDWVLDLRGDNATPSSASL